MSSLPFISHHLFVAAVRHDSRAHPRSPQNEPDHECCEGEIVSTETPAGEFAQDLATEQISGSLLLSES